jgi:hypothetical protein
MNMCESGVKHPKGSTSGLKGGSPNGSPPSELPLGESPSCLPFDGWWVETLGMWVGKLVVTYTLVGTSAITSY